MKHNLLHLQSLLAVALCVIMSVTFSGCGDDDDEPEKDSKNLETILVGTWINDDGEYFVLNSYGSGQNYLDHESYVNKGKCDIITSWSCKDNVLNMVIDSEFEGEVYTSRLIAKSVSENEIVWSDEHDESVTWHRYK